MEHPTQFWCPKGVDPVAQNDKALKTAKTRDVEFHAHVKGEDCIKTDEPFSFAAPPSDRCWVAGMRYDLNPGS